ncbi:inositol 5-phosphatase [Microdochium bolleyi]|uniref:Inositol 5-phosphatase n=1 Tax=Microdochium bolleyi TaxID=196109 RepID=A0A136JAK1_9PEZI|nr:inositol 5-phosphatase [Microdochium bolleyi]
MALEQLPTADVFVLTFNAQKQLINVPVFATHLLDAFSEHAGALPDLVVFSLQEMAPLAKAFIGTQMLGQYFGAYGEALNRAAARHHAEHASSGEDATGKKDPFSLVATRNVGMTSSMLFARDAAAVSNVRAAEVGFGAGDMANKGAVGLRLLYTGESDSDSGSRSGSGREARSNKTEMTFVTTHLAAMEWNLAKRNKNWESLVSGLVFEDPKKHVDRAAAQSRDRGAAEPRDEAQGLLEGDEHRSSRASSLERELHNLSIYKPGSHLFVAGDLNYRIAATQPDSDDVFPSTDPSSPDYYPRFLERDQLSHERRAGRTLHGLSEAEIKFPPTYKLVVLPKDQDEQEQEQEQEAEAGEGLAVDNVKWKWATHRWPGWCDRILYRDLPQGRRMQVVGYNALAPVRTSDHRPVYLRIRVPLVEPEALAGAPDAIDDDESGVPDTRVKLPFPIDVDSWHHRASVRRWEAAMGWSLLAAQSKEVVAAVLATIVVLGAGVWWYTALS